jgi:hypothetical protein
MKTLLYFTFLLLGVLLGVSSAESQQLRVGENLRHENLFLPPSTPEKDRLVVIDYGRIEDEAGGVAILIFYDDVRTKPEVDYVELYNVAGDLLLVSWIDPFGIRHLAMDRGLLDEEEPGIDRVFVLITGGISL